MRKYIDKLMHLLLNNLTDKELLLRIRKHQDQEAAGALLDRYSHLLVALSLPHLSAESRAETAFPDLTRQLYARLLHSTTNKVNEVLYALVTSYFSMRDKTQPPLPLPYEQAIQRLETRVENAGNNPIEKEALAAQLEKAFGTLQADEQMMVTRFYLEHQSLSDLAESQHTTTDEVRNKLKGAKKKLATYLMDQAYEQ